MTGRYAPPWAPADCGINCSSFSLSFSLSPLPLAIPPLAMCVPFHRLSCLLPALCLSGHLPPLPGLSGPPLSPWLPPLSCLPAVHMGRPFLPTLGLASSAVPASSSRSRQAAWTPTTSGLCLSPQDTAWYAASASPRCCASPPPPLRSLPLLLTASRVSVSSGTLPQQGSAASPLPPPLLPLLGWGLSDDSLSCPPPFLEVSGERRSGLWLSPLPFSLSFFLSSLPSRAKS